LVDTKQGRAMGQGKGNRKCRHYTFEEKKLAMESYFSDRYKGSGMSLAQFSAVCGINRWTLRDWARAIDWDRTQIDKLRRKRRRPKAVQTVIGLQEPVQELIIEIKKQNRSWGPLKIKQYLFRHEQMLIPQTSIYRLLKAKGLVNERVEPAEVPKHERSFEYPYAMAAVQMDLMSLTLSSGQTIYLVTLIDDFSRFVLTTRFVPVKTMDEVIDVFKQSIVVYGVMEKVLTDYGSEFVSWQCFTRFEQLLVDLDIEYIASGPDKKENQGKIERWHQTVRQALRERGPLDYSSEAQLWIAQVADHYNYERPHQALGGLVPGDRFFGVHEELDVELQKYRRGQRPDQRLYFACRIGDQKIVVSGPRSEQLGVLVNGVRLGGPSSPAPEGFERR
jgi:transposase InsO family protein